jgi:hypothetical protein
MRTLRPFLTLASALAFLFVSLAAASVSNEQTKITFNEPVEVPGMVLPAGTYTFSLLPGASDRNIVQIYNAAGTKFYTNVLAIPDYRIEPTGKTVLKFEERAPGSPEAIRVWFYPGLQFGQEFVYPKTRAMEIAKANHKPVAYTEADLSNYNKTEMKTGKEAPANGMRSAHVGHVDENGNATNDTDSQQPAQH